MAEVHLARRPATGEIVVLKRILPDLARRPDFIGMFAEEARLMGQLQPHPHVVRLLQAGHINGVWYQALGFVDGPDLAVVMSHGARLGESIPLVLATWIAARAADGLQHVHDACDATGRPLSIVHRDVSPSNVLLSKDGDVCIADFGIARFAGSAVRTETDVLKGKAAYMSPEQCLGAVVDARSDVFALGIVLHELLTGRPLFGANNPLVAMHQITSGPIAPPSAFNPHIDHRLDDVVMKALERQPDRRFQTARALGEALDAWRHSLGEVVDAAVCGQWLSRLLLAVPSTNVDDTGAPPFAFVDHAAWAPGPFRPITCLTNAAMVVTLADPDQTLVEAPRRGPGRRLLRPLARHLARRPAAVASAVAMAMAFVVGIAVQPGADVVAAPGSEHQRVSAVIAVPDEVSHESAPIAKTPPFARPDRKHPRRPQAWSSSSRAMGSLSVRTTPPTVVSTAADLIDSTPFVGKPLGAGFQRLTLRNHELGIHDEIIVKVPKNRNVALIATYTKVNNAWVISTKSTREYR